VKERQSLRFEANITNLLNQHSVLAYYEGFNSANFQTPLKPQNINLFSGAALYQTLESGYNPQQWINGNNGATRPVIKSSWYGQPQQYQLLRGIRLGVNFTF